jgi:hypothetical protein
VRRELWLITRWCDHPRSPIAVSNEAAGRDCRRGCVEEEQVDVSGLAQDQALHDERGAAGDREAGALGQAEEQLRGFYLKRCQQTGRHLIRCVSADGVDQRLPRASQWGWQDEVRPH